MANSYLRRWRGTTTSRNPSRRPSSFRCSVLVDSCLRSISFAVRATFVVVGSLMRDVRRGRGEAGSAGVQWQARPWRTISQGNLRIPYAQRPYPGNNTAYLTSIPHNSATSAVLVPEPRLSTAAVPRILPQQCRCQTYLSTCPSTIPMQTQNGKLLLTSCPLHLGSQKQE